MKEFLLYGLQLFGLIAIIAMGIAGCRMVAQRKKMVDSCLHSFQRLGRAFLPAGALSQLDVIQVLKENGVSVANGNTIPDWPYCYDIRGKFNGFSIRLYAGWVFGEDAVQRFSLEMERRSSSESTKIVITEPESKMAEVLADLHKYEIFKPDGKYARNHV